MIPTSLQRLKDCHVALIAALDGQDIDAIESSIVEFRDVVEEVRAAGGWRDNADIVDQVATILSLSEAARIRVNFLTDINQQRIELLSMARGRGPGAAYRRDGSQSA